MPALCNAVEDGWFRCSCTRMLQVVDPKEAARKKAEESRAAASAAKMAKHAAGSKKISAFFTAKK